MKSLYSSQNDSRKAKEQRWSKSLPNFKPGWLKPVLSEATHTVESSWPEAGHKITDDVVTE